MKSTVKSTHPLSINLNFNRVLGLFVFLNYQLLWLSFLICFVKMIANPFSRNFYIDEMVYIGDWFYYLVTQKFHFYWSVSSKQPLFFWIIHFVYLIFPQSIRNSPGFMLITERYLSGIYILLALICNYKLLRLQKNRSSNPSKFLAMAAATLPFLSSPFILVHAQLGIVEPLLIFLFSAMTYSLYRSISKPTHLSLCFLFLASIALVFTKTSGFIPVVSALMISLCFFILSAKQPQLRSRFARIAQVELIVGFLGFLLVRLNPEVKKEGIHIFALSGRSFERIGNQLQTHLSLIPYYRPLLCLLGLLLSVFLLIKFGITKESRKRALNWFSKNLELTFIALFLIVTSMTSIGAITIGLEPTIIPRYYLFSFLPWILLSCLFLGWITQWLAQYQRIRSSKQHQQLALGVISLSVILFLFSDLKALMPIYQGSEGNSLRINSNDKRQYYDIFAIKTLHGIEDLITLNNAEVYTLYPPYMEGMILRVLLGFKDAKNRLKPLPMDVSGINKISCNPAYKATYFLFGSWAIPVEKQKLLKDVTQISSYSANRPEGVNMILYQKNCVNSHAPLSTTR